VTDIALELETEDEVAEEGTKAVVAGGKWTPSSLLAAGKKHLGSLIEAIATHLSTEGQLQVAERLCEVSMPN